MERQDKIIYGNTFYHHFEKGIYNQVVYLDFKSYYPTIFKQICNHIDEQYFGKKISSIVKRKTCLNELKLNGVPFSNEALKKPVVYIDDIAKQAIKIDSNGKDEMVRMIESLSNANFYDEADSRVSKITRNALVFGFGFQQKNARINNISALVMFFAKEVMHRTIEQLNINGRKIIFSHTDSFVLENIDVAFKEVDNAIRTACGIVDMEYFGNTEVISLGLNNINIKAKWEDLIVLNQNSYIGSTIAPHGKREIHLRISGLHTNSECWGGIDKQGKDIQDTLYENYDGVFSNNQIQNADKEFLYSVLKYRLAPEYEISLREKWLNNDATIYKKAIIVSKTLRHINLLKRMCG